MNKGSGQALGSIFGAAGPRRGAPPPPPDAAAPASVAAFLLVVDRLEAVVEAETAALRRAIPDDIAATGDRKRQGLLEMERASRAAASAGPRPEVRERLGRFAAALERNRAALGTQLRAAREIADIVAAVMAEAESDGTYSPAAGWA